MTTYQMWDKVPAAHSEVPVLEYYPAESKKSDAAVIILPGGGYEWRAEHEGRGYAEYLDSIGVDSFVCRYRVSPHRFPLPLLDARRAVRFVRANAEKFGVSPDRIAVMGSSAGGHLAALVSTYTGPIEFEGADETDSIDPTPNATILCYPVIHKPDETKVAHVGSFRNLMGEDCEYDKVSADLLVNDKTPPAFIWHTSDDGAVNVINSYLYASALRRHNIPHELHVFPNGNHGLGLAGGAPHVAQWTKLLESWLGYIGWLTK